jgi:hypothetical protein
MANLKPSFASRADADGQIEPDRAEERASSTIQRGDTRHTMRFKRTR